MRARRSSIASCRSLASSHGDTAAEIAARADATPEQVLEAEVAANAYRAIPIDGEREGASLVDGLRIEDPGLALAERAAIVGQRLSVLDERDREILRLRFGDDLIQTEIGERIGVSQMQVSRLIRRSLAALHEIAEQAESSAS